METKKLLELLLDLLSKYASTELKSECKKLIKCDSNKIQQSLILEIIQYLQQNGFGTPGSDGLPGAPGPQGAPGPAGSSQNITATAYSNIFTLNPGEDIANAPTETTAVFNMQNPTNPGGWLQLPTGQDIEILIGGIFKITYSARIIFLFNETDVEDIPVTVESRIYVNGVFQPVLEGEATTYYQAGLPADGSIRRDINTITRTFLYNFAVGDIINLRFTKSIAIPTTPPGAWWASSNISFFKIADSP